MFHKRLLIFVGLQCFILNVTLLPVPNSPKEDAAETKATVKPIVVKSVEKSGFPEEIQMAQCTITSGDIKAQAQATFSQKLENVCSTDDMANLTKSLGNLEKQLLTEIYNLKLMIQSLSGNNVANSYVQPQSIYQPHNNYQKPYNQHTYSNYQAPQTFVQPAYPNYYNTRHDYAPAASNSVAENSYPRMELKSLETSHILPPSNFIFNTTPRTTTPKTTTTTSATTTPATTPLITTTPQIFIQPSTRKVEVESRIVETKSLKSLKPSAQEKPRKIVSDSNELSYFWKLENFPKVFKTKSTEAYSYVFNVNKLHLRIRAFMNQHEDMLLELEHLANVENREMNVELYDGIVFKEIATEKLFQYHFEVMDLTRDNHNLISPKYWNTDDDAGFWIQNSVVVLSGYAKNDSILIKLLISF